jgi:hypothetical protein
LRQASHAAELREPDMAARAHALVVGTKSCLAVVFEKLLQALGVDRVHVDAVVHVHRIGYWLSL